MSTLECLSSISIHVLRSASTFPESRLAAIKADLKIKRVAFLWSGCRCPQAGDALHPALPQSRGLTHRLCSGPGKEPAVRTTILARANSCCVISQLGFS